MAAGFRVTGELFTLESTCDESFVRETAWCLEETFGAYRRHIGIRKQSPKMKIYLLADRDEYVSFQTRRPRCASPYACRGPQTRSSWNARSTSGNGRTPRR